jgi:hypothetical protein
VCEAVLAALAAPGRDGATLAGPRYAVAHCGDVIPAAAAARPALASSTSEPGPFIKAVLLGSVRNI